ncbi:AAA family ATPase [Bradyrhizobium sp. TM233]|uniref:AAA family ATPase n=1 Tax=Bradyrhizobium sp. TM233 TaxID=2599801 RepID=UPI0027D6023B|nr:hypothetical protein TM233_28080 [Bradyrhizobium sp. TM233]
MPSSNSALKNVTAFDPESIQQFLEIIHDRAHGLDGYFVVSVFIEDAPGTITHHRVGDVEGTRESVAAHADTPGANVYMPLCVMRRDLPRGRKGGEADVVAVIGLVADMDADTGKIGEMPMKPSFMIETSPGNTQQVILFDKPLPPEEAKPLAVALKKASGSDHGTADISHVWRIPGTLNWPTKTKALKEPFQGLVYSGSQLADSLSSVLDEPQAGTQFDERFSGRVEAASLWDGASDILRAALLSDGLPDRSEHAASVFEHCGFEGLSLNEAISLCLAKGGAWKERYGSEVALITDAERCWNKFVLPKKAEREANARAAKAFVENAREKREENERSNAIVATPFVFQDPSTLPRRDNLYGGHFIRRYVSSTVGSGGGGKSSLEVTDTLGMVTANPPLRVWYFNLEDPLDEIQRRVTAAAMHHGVDPEVLNVNLFVDSGRDQSLVVVTTTKFSK